MARQFIYGILPTDGFDEALEALVQADFDLYSAIHEASIRQSFAFAKIYGSASSYPFTTTWVRSPARPYPDNESSEQVLSLPGAALAGGVRFTFGDQSDVNAYDVLEVRDAGGALITSLTKGNVAGTTVVVPDSDEARIKIVSVPSDTFTGNGYSVVAASPVNEGTAPTFSATATPALGMDPQPVTFCVTGADLALVRIATGDGSPDGFPVPDASGAWVFEHVYNYDVNQGPILELRSFEATITVVNEDALSASTTKTIWVKPYRPDGAFHLAEPAAGALGSAGARGCALTPTGFDCP